jgi:hypothetical protein
MSAELLVLRRDGALWGVRGDAVTGIDPVAAGVRLHLAGGGELDADAVEGLAHGATLRGVPLAVRRRLPVALEGLALWEHRPLAVLAVSGGGSAAEVAR